MKVRLKEWPDGWGQEATEVAEGRLLGLCWASSTRVSTTGLVLWTLTDHRAVVWSRAEGAKGKSEMARSPKGAHGWTRGGGRQEGDPIGEQKPELDEGMGGEGADGVFLEPVPARNPPSSRGFRRRRRPPSAHHGAACVLLRSVTTRGQRGPRVPETLAQSLAGVCKVARSPST